MAWESPSHRRDEPDRLSDEELACQTQAGSSACFAELVGRYEQRLLRFLIQRTHHVQDAEDLLQDTFARAYQRIDSYDPTWKVSTWLFTIASRLACSFHRKASAKPLLEPGQQASGCPDPSAIAARNEERENLWALAAQVLSVNQYTALWLRYAEEMSVKEISRVMKKTQSHVKVLLFRGRGGLGRRLQRSEARGRTVRSTASAPAACAAGAAEGGG
jgi:RNA polymerase sigma-70 factor (ECF subfamily)